jgi:hypothetical protein
MYNALDTDPMSKEQKGYSHATNRISPSQKIGKKAEDLLKWGLEGEARCDQSGRPWRGTHKGLPILSERLRFVRDPSQGLESRRTFAEATLLC